MTRQPAQKIDFEIKFRLSHAATPAFWENSEGIYRWLAELRVSNSESPESHSVVIGAASIVCVDTIDCDDFVVDLDWLDADLGKMADVVRRTLIEDGGGHIVCSNVRVLFIEDVALDPHWRGRGLGPAMTKIAARTIGGVDALYLIPCALQTLRDEHGVWATSYDLPRPGKTAQTKVRKAWKDAGFSRRLGTVYQLMLGDDRAIEEAQIARRHLAALTFTQADRAWWIDRASHRASGLA
jgi:GNAT superfamily N-acetyltransferase